MLTQTYLPPQTYQGLQAADRAWYNLRHGLIKPQTVVTEGGTLAGEPEFDVVIAGGTLGIFLAATLQQAGWRVAVVEKGKLQGRIQEWNISRAELSNFVQLGLLTQEELETAIVTEYNPGRVGFAPDYELWVKDVLNVGVDPVYLLATLKQKFLEAGGTLMEHQGFESAQIHDRGVTVQLPQQQITTRLLIDAMGHFSPIAAQVRGHHQPDGVCLVVGSCAEGFSPEQNNHGDLIYTFTPITHHCQYFWEAFPAQDGRTTYLFTYGDAAPERFSLEFLMEEYLRLLPDYQGIPLEQLEFKRFLFGFFPAYKASPLDLPWDRVVAIGDSSGSQSPVSFGGFGAMVRHLPRLTLGLNQALGLDFLDRPALKLLQPYQPNIAINWLFQKAMGVTPGKPYQPDQVNRLMGAVFQGMEQLGEPVLKPFLQDVIQWGALTKTLPRVNPLLVLPLLPTLGIGSLGEWLTHYVQLGTYSILAKLGPKYFASRAAPSLRQRYIRDRSIEAWQYGSGQDYHRPHS